MNSLQAILLSLVAASCGDTTFTSQKRQTSKQKPEAPIAGNQEETNAQTSVPNTDSDIVSPTVFETPRRPQKPKEGCQAFFSGIFLADKVLEIPFGSDTSQLTSVIFQPDDYSEWVGAGRYPSNEDAFPKSVKTTFDSFAFDRDTKVTLFSGKDFTGKILYEGEGPAVIYNIQGKSVELVSSKKDKNWDYPLQELFPQTVRSWSRQPMRDWSFGSVKVACRQKNSS